MMSILTLEARLHEIFTKGDEKFLFGMLHIRYIAEIGLKRKVMTSSYRIPHADPAGGQEGIVAPLKVYTKDKYYCC